MIRKTLPAMIRDLLTTGDLTSRQQNADWIRSLVDGYCPPSLDDLAELIYIATGVRVEDADLAEALQATGGR